MSTPFEGVKDTHAERSRARATNKRSFYRRQDRLRLYIIREGILFNYTLTLCVTTRVQTSRANGNENSINFDPHLYIPRANFV